MKVYIVSYKNVKDNTTINKQFLDQKRAKKFINEIRKDKNKLLLGSQYEELDV